MQVLVVAALRLQADMLRKGMSQTDQKPPARGHQLEVLQSVTELMDSLPTQEAKREVLAFLAASLGVTIKEPAAPRTGRGYSYRARRG